jgi:hypothetical protein
MQKLTRRLVGVRRLRRSAPTRPDPGAVGPPFMEREAAPATGPLPFLRENRRMRVEVDYRERVELVR